MSLNEIKFREINEDIRKDVLAISVHDHQIDFQPSISSSLKLAKRYANAAAQAVEIEGKVCGFILYGIDEEASLWKIFRLVIDKQYQGNGIGKAALKKILHRLRDTYSADKVIIVFQEQNTVARNLYYQLGFVQYDKKGNRILAKVEL